MPQWYARTFIGNGTRDFDIEGLGILKNRRVLSSGADLYPQGLALFGNHEKKQSDAGHCSPRWEINPQDVDLADLAYWGYFSRKPRTRMNFLPRMKPAEFYDRGDRGCHLCACGPDSGWRMVKPIWRRRLKVF